MKNTLLLLLLITVLTSCKKTKEEQLVFDYEAKSLKDALKIDINDTDFKINNVEQIGFIKSIDSVNYYKDKLATLWLGENTPQETKDTLTYKYVAGVLDKGVKSYSNIIMSYLKADMEHMTYDAKRKRKNYRELQSKVFYWSIKNNTYSKNKDSILAYKYKANTTMTSPVLKMKQTFDKVYYTDASGTNIVGTLEQ